ncbi:hypothetical protein [Paenibacillus nuruki]|uniref:hypothetical protein n=1 Tax=Paenibacillus nuruki TaxID=1886670 RepID=UPI00280524FE|nr:hypothetical protein [Paenibacillus nuruki]CAJ1315921.1 hypothetical protein AASFL403_11910 [Paenibacillus nuruki]
MKIQKIGGEYPLKTVVLSETIEFDEKGIADVSEDVADILLSIPGYKEVIDKKSQSKSSKDSDGVNNDVPPVADEKENQTASDPVTDDIPAAEDKATTTAKSSSKASKE